MLLILESPAHPTGVIRMSTIPINLCLNTYSPLGELLGKDEEVWTLKRYVLGGLALDLQIIWCGL